MDRLEKCSFTCTIVAVEGVEAGRELKFDLAEVSEVVDCQSFEAHWSPSDAKVSSA